MKKSEEESGFVSLEFSIGANSDSLCLSRLFSLRLSLFQKCVRAYVRFCSIIYNLCQEKNTTRYFFYFYLFGVRRKKKLKTLLSSSDRRQLQHRSSSVAPRLGSHVDGADHLAVVVIILVVVAEPPVALAVATRGRRRRRNNTNSSTSLLPVCRRKRPHRPGTPPTHKTPLPSARNPKIAGRNITEPW